MISILKESEIKGIRFKYREDNSDIKTFNEVLGKGAYERSWFKIEPGETWYDLGGNVGAFTLLACSKGANVVVYEPDPNCCAMIEKNLKLNGFNADIRNSAVVADDRKEAFLFTGYKNSSWRNSIEKNWKKKSRGRYVSCVNFDEEIPDGICVKMDIEGSEMPILESTTKVFNKLVYEWSFDLDPDIKRLWDVLDRQSRIYDFIPLSKAVNYDTRHIRYWPANWMPKCTNVYCKKKEL